MKQHIEQLIAQNRLEEAIEQLFQLFTICLKQQIGGDLHDNYNMLITESGKLQGVLQDQRTGIIRIDDANLVKAQVRNSLLYQINLLPAAFFDAPISIKTSELETSDNLTLREQVVRSQNKTYEYDIFLSFSSKDLDWVKPICNELRGYGLRVFFSDDNLRLKAGVSFMTTISNALLSSKNFVLVCTPNSMESPYVVDEYETFYQQCAMQDRVNRLFVIYAGAADFKIDLVPALFRRFQFAASVLELVDAFVDKQSMTKPEPATKPESSRTTISKTVTINTPTANTAAKEAQELEDRQRKAQAEAEDRLRQRQAQAEQEAKRQELERQQKAQAEEEQRKQKEQQKLQAEMDLWEKCSGEDTAKAYQTYLKQYPKGQFATQAKEQERLQKTKEEEDLRSRKLADEEQLRQHKAQQLLQAELDFWDRCSLEDTAKAYQAYLKQYPKGQFAQQAKELYETLKKTEPTKQISNKNIYVIASALASLVIVFFFIKGCHFRPSAEELAKKIADSTMRADSIKMAESQSPLMLQQDSLNRVKEDSATKANHFNVQQTLNSNIDMVYVAGGSFDMGNNQKFSEDPVHRVRVGSFYICKYEVTQSQWKAIMGNNPSFNKGDNLPVEQVSWNDIQTFIKKLNKTSSKHYRLPTEAEWEFAARGGNKSKGYKYSGSDNLGSVAWYDENSGNKTHPVGQKQANELGIYDMSGNVWECCQDWFKGYTGSKTYINDDGIKPTSRVRRGGDYYHGTDVCRSTYRSEELPSDRFNTQGFRLVLAP